VEELLIGILIFCSVLAIGGALIAASSAKRDRIRQRLHDGRQLPAAAQPKEEPTILVRLLSKLGVAVSAGKTSSTLREQLAQAGYYGAAAAMVFLGLKIVLLVLALAVLLPLLVPLQLSLFWKLLCVLSGAGLLFFLPNIVVSVARQRRQHEIRSHLPDVIDLLEVCVSSGMSMDMAWTLVTDEIRRVSQTFADEMALTNLEIHLGAARVGAMRHLAERTQVEEIASLVAVLVQSERFGTSIADALRAFASSMREGRSARAEESAEKMAVRLLFPMVLFVFPAVLIVLAGPAGVRLFEIMGRR